MSFKLSYALLYVNEPQKSEQFYTKLFGIKPVESAPTFVLFVLANGMKLGLWIKKDVHPPVAVNTVASSELDFEVDDVDAVCEQWKAAGAKIVQKPMDLDFGRSFVAEDPDGHRLRALKLAERPE